MLLRLKALFTFEKIKLHWPVLILLLISLLICNLNYTPGTYLSGWDTLHPEFNFSLNFERTINGVFRMEQGLGAVAAHSHMADLPRITILYVAHFLIPQSFLRYFYIDLCLIFGTLGMYLMLKKHFLKNTAASFLGALFYLLNLGTIQTFNVPFEMFTTLFAMLPFIFYLATAYLSEKHNRTKNLLLFSIAVIFAGPSAYAATLWFVFFLCFFVYFLIYAFINLKHDKLWLKHFLILIGAMLALNFYWLLPNIYFILMHGKEVANANINILFSDQAFLKNKEFGNIRDILFLKSFYFDWKVYIGNNQFVDLLLPFINHLQISIISIISYVLAGGLITGAAHFTHKFKRNSLPALAVFIICLFFLFNDNFPVSLAYDFFQKHIPFFKEALRFPDDKILNIFEFILTIFFGFFTLFIIEKANKIKLNFNKEIVIVFIVSLILIIYSLPVFTGNLINPTMRVKIPQSYFALFNYLNKQPENLTVANFPIHSPWGWAYYDWSSEQNQINQKLPSFQGAGFLYFGIKQPLLDRDFDRWSPYNESYYREMSYAIYKQDVALLTNVLNKYKIGFVLIDSSVINPQNSNLTLYLDQSKSLLEQTGMVLDKKTFNNLELFKMRSASSVISSTKTNVNINPSPTTLYSDWAYNEYQDYLSLGNIANLSNVTYPFRDLINNQSKLHEELISETNSNILLNTLYKNSNYKLDSLSDNLNIIPVDLYARIIPSGLALTFKPIIPTVNKGLEARLTETINFVPQNHNLVLSAGSKSLINLDNLSSNSSLYVGRITLENKQSNISIFNKNSSIQIPNTNALISPFFSACNKDFSPPTAGLINNGFKLIGKGDLCITIPFVYLPKQQDQLSNILVNFQFDFIGTADVNSCLYDIINSSCLSYNKPQITGNTMLFTYPIKASESQKLAIKIFLKTNNNNQNIYNLLNINSSISKSLASLEISKSFLNNLLANTNNNLLIDKIFIPKNTDTDNKFDITKTHLVNDCKAEDAIKEIENENGIKIVKYTSNLGSFCDHFSFPALAHNQGYIITINSKHLSGLPLTLCVSNYTSRRCDIYANLSSFETLRKDVFMLPPMDDNGTGYDLNFENLGIKGTTSINYLSQVEIIPVPYQLLSKVKSQNLINNSYLGEVSDINKLTTFMYTAKITSKPTVLTFNKSYEKGFKAYMLNCSSAVECFILANLTPLFSTPITNHVLINNWANGWIINNEQANIKNPHILIVFLPQYFEILGFIALIAVFILLLYHLKLHK